MPIPRAILDVDRPVNTVVVAYGKNKDRYAVRERVGCKYVNGRRIPVNGATIGHIVDGRYIPKTEEPGPEKVSVAPVDLKDWGAATLCDEVARPLLDELCAVYDGSDALKLYCACILRVCYPGIKDCELKEAYDTSFLSELYPGVALSKNTVSEFWKDIGKAYSMICRYMKLRAAAVENGHHLIIDGTLKSNDSTVNSLSDLSRKARLKGTRDISVLYAYDMELGEPICSKCFPGNMLDATAYDAFISDNGIKRGIIVGDKGFPSSSAKRHFAENKDLHYLNPLKRNSKLIDSYELLAYEGQLPENETVLYKKVHAAKEGKWLYSFRDTAKAHAEEYGWLKSSTKKGKFDIDQFDEDWLLFGTIVFESDLDMEPQTAYKAYGCRWEIELVMRYYKQACEFGETRVHKDFSVIGSEFCSFLSTIVTYRLLRRYENTGLLKKMTYKKILRVLTRAKKACLDGETWHLIKMNPSQLEVLQTLSLLSKPAPKKRGRPRKTSV